MTIATQARTGGDVVIESLTALGANTVFGIPGQHALGTFAALAGSSLRYVGLRTELSAGFAADGYARSTGSVAPLLVSTGPGALISLAALQEAAPSSVPVLVVSSQIPRAGLGGLRKGFLHELREQLASVRGIVKSPRRTCRARADRRLRRGLTGAPDRRVAPHEAVWTRPFPRSAAMSTVPSPHPR